jgi:ribose-phosphate pyrophosphokinase
MRRLVDGESSWPSVESSTDTVPVAPNKKAKKITVLSMAPLLGEAIHRIHTGLSMGAMFE